MYKTVIRVVAASAMIVLLAVACGDDGGGDDVAAYCDFVAELNESEETPTDEQLDQIKDLAPSEISGQVALLADALQDGGEEAFLDADEDLITASEEVDAYGDENCEEGE